MHIPLDPKLEGDVNVQKIVDIIMAEDFPSDIANKYRIKQYSKGSGAIERGYEIYAHELPKFNGNYPRSGEASITSIQISCRSRKDRVSLRHISWYLYTNSTNPTKDAYYRRCQDARPVKTYILNSRNSPESIAKEIIDFLYCKEL